MEKKDSKKYNIVLIILVLLIGVLGFIIFNSVKADGKSVLKTSYDPNLDIISYSGYEVSGGNFKYLQEDEHYVTFRHIDQAREMLIIFNKNPEVDNIYVWCMTYDGTILDEYNLDYDRNNRFLVLSDLPGGTTLISLQVDSDFVVREVLSSAPYHDNHERKIILVVTLAAMALVFIVFKLFHIFDKKFVRIFDGVAEKLSDKKAFGEKVLVSLGTLLGAAAASFGIVWLLSILGVSLFSKEVTLNHKSVITMFFTLGFFVILVMKRKYFKEKPEMVGILALLAVGMIYSLVEPTSLGVSWDDEAHYDNANRMAHFIDVKKSMADYELINMYQIVATDRYSYDKDSSEDINSVYNYLDKEGYMTEFEGNYVNLSRAVYLPMAMGLIFARGLCLPYTVCLIIGRMFNMLFLVLISYFSTKALKEAGFIVPLIMLIPVNVFIASAYSYDTWLTCWILLGYAVLFAERQQLDEPMRVSSQIVIPVVFFIATLIKPVYFVFALPAFFITLKKFKKKWRVVVYYISLLAAMSFPFIYVMISAVANAGTGDTRGGSDVNAAVQLQEAKANIPYVAGVIGNFLKDYLNPFNHGALFSMWNAYNGQCKGGLIVMLTILLGAIIIHDQSDKRTFPIWYRIGAILLYVGVGVIVSFSMYVYYTPVGADHVEGCQWRYIIPALFPVLFILSRIPVKTYILDKVGRLPVYTVLSVIMMMLSVYALWVGCVSYY